LLSFSGANSKPDVKANDFVLTERNSTIKSYTTTRATYPGLRVFYRRHQQADNLPTSPAPVPLLVFIHGLGGSVSQFNGLLTSLTPIATCLAVDLPGCGRSEFAPQSWDAYSTNALVELLETVIEDHRDAVRGQGVVLIGHSMGSSLAALLANPRNPKTELHEHILGIVAICPPAGFADQAKARILRTALGLPGFGLIFDAWRAWDRRGGLDSPSVYRFVGPNADAETRRLQHVFNCQSRTPVWRRMAWGALPVYSNGVQTDGIASLDVWAGLNLPVFLIAGTDDQITPPTEVDKILSVVSDTKTEPSADGRDGESSADEQADANGAPRLPALPQRPEKYVSHTKLPSPAGHALLYASPTVPVLAGLVSDFLASHITGRLSLAWQLQYQGGKWDVKNLEKWRNVAPVSEPVGGVFRAIKTLREVDDEHCPRVFVKKWSHTIKDVIDISHDNPVYNPRGLEEGGIRYHKYPLLSKVPPNDAEIAGFVELVDKIRAEQHERAKAEGWEDGYVVAVHCHYGFNRTGFLIACYLVERCGFTPKEAIEAFAKARPNGIRHAHFRDRLHVRYSGVKSDT
jgi:pimeloyl-ACP methyl ester carboxylesterase/protein-tyrosine phosphatase